MVIDDTDRAIIDGLQRDGRMPYVKLARLVGLSEAAVRQRVQRLTDAGVVQIAAIVEPQAIGLRRTAMVGITADGDVRAVADKLSMLQEVTYLVITAGSFDLLAEVVVADDEALLELVNERIRSVPGVRHTEVFVYLRLSKQTYDYGTR